MKRTTYSKIIVISFVVSLVGAASIFFTARHMIEQNKEIKVLNKELKEYREKEKVDSVRKALQAIYDFIPDYEFTDEERKVAEERFLELIVDHIERENEMKSKLKEQYNMTHSLDLPSNDSIY